MDFFLLPEKVKSQMEGLSAAGGPVGILRSSSCLEGTPGECYLVGFPCSLHLFSKRLGEDSYRRVDVPLAPGAPVSLALRKESFDTFLDIDAGGARHSVKFSSFEGMSLEPLVKRWDALLKGSGEARPKVKIAPESEPASESEGSLSPLAGMAAALMFASTVDGEISEVEDQYIKRICNGRDADLQAALAFYKAHDIASLPGELGHLSHEQRLCIVANLCEACMADGTLRSCEQELVWNFASALGVERGEYETVRDVLLLKNRVAVLHGAAP